MRHAGFRLRLLLGLLIVAAFAAALTITAEVTRETAMSDLLRRSQSDLQLYMANIRRELEKYDYLPALLSKDASLAGLLRHPADDDARQRVNHYLALVAQTSNASDVYLMDGDGVTLAASNWNQPDSFVGDDYSFRPYFQQAMQGRLGRYYALGWSSRQRGYYLAYPLTRGGEILGAVAVKVPIGALEREQGGADREFIVTDPHGIVFLSTRAGWRFHALKPLSADLRQQVLDSQRYGDHKLPALPISQRSDWGDDAELVHFADDGATYLRSAAAMPVAGWTVHILANTEGVQSQVVRATLLAAFALAVLLLAGYAVYQRRRQLRERLHFERAAMEATAANEARVRAVIDNTHAGLVTLDEAYRIRTANPPATALLKRSAGTLRGMPFRDLVSTDERPTFDALVSETATDHGGNPVTELTAERPDGSNLPLEIAINSMDLAEGRRYLVTLHDISERRRNEDALRQAHDELERRVQERTADLRRSNERLTREIEEHRATESELSTTRDELVQAAKLAAIGQLSAGINHELNQPLTALRAFADNARMLLARERPAEVDENLGQIASLAERMGRITGQLKLFARRSSGVPVAVDPAKIIDAAFALLTPRLEREGVEIVWRPEEGGAFCLGDTVRLEQVVVNLVSNAMQAMADSDVRRIEVTQDSADDRVRISVRDTGPGIGEDALPHVFDAFFTTKEAGQGLGLGLSISSRIIEEMGGTLQARNHPDGGAVFVIELLRARGESHG